MKDQGKKLTVGLLPLVPLVIWGLLSVCCGKLQSGEAAQESRAVVPRATGAGEMVRTPDRPQSSKIPAPDRWTPSKVVTPVRGTRTWFSYAGETYDMSQLTEIAIRQIRIEEPGVAVTNLWADITFQVEAQGALAEVILGGIGKTCWIVTIDRNMRVQSVRKSFGRG